MITAKGQGRRVNSPEEPVQFRIDRDHFFIRSGRGMIESSETRGGEGCPGGQVEGQSLEDRPIPVGWSFFMHKKAVQTGDSC